MALYEYHCRDCKITFEQLANSRDPHSGRCPKCKKRNTKKLISPFNTTGRGDTRSSTLHGCHDCEVAHDTKDHPYHEHGYKKGAPHKKKKASA